MLSYADALKLQDLLTLPSDLDAHMLAAIAPPALCRRLGTTALHGGNSRNQVFNFIHLGPERFSDFDVVYSGRQVA
jgi:hypothetical protein